MGSCAGCNFDAEDFGGDVYELFVRRIASQREDNNSKYCFTKCRLTQERGATKNYVWRAESMTAFIQQRYRELFPDRGISASMQGNPESDASSGIGSTEGGGSVTGNL
ncbi:unnamed protein product [Heligmosomoides polygyrus]|uniref:HNH endonuclease n=1 Tax=Heligmosomoides polygyrus TaxID=6339 RepID=A0A183FGI9_HELPZ|nr:unnamed protein product [Heligmosomoides polygyrus]